MRPAVCAGQLEHAASCSPVGLGQPEQPLTRIQPPPTPKLAQPRRSGPAVLGWEEEGQASPQPCDGTPTQKAFRYRAELTRQASQDPSLLWAAARHALAGLCRASASPQAVQAASISSALLCGHLLSSKHCSAGQLLRRLRSEKAFIRQLLDHENLLAISLLVSVVLPLR